MQAKQDAQRFISASKQGRAQFDYALAFLLQMPEGMQSRVEACAALKGICAELGVDPSAEFMLEIARHLEEAGMQSVFPSDYVACKGKEGAIQKYRQAEWGQPHFPVLMQVSGKTYRESLFFVFRTAQDAILMCMEMKRQKSYAYTDISGTIIIGVHQFTEHVMPGAPSYAMFDCELYLSYFSGRIDKQRLHDEVDEFPSCILGKMAALRITEDRMGITVAFKEKSRDVVRNGKEDYKCSKHFLTSLWAFAEDHTAAVYSALSHDKRWIEACQDYLGKHDTLDCLEDMSEDPTLQLGLLSMDKAAMPGGKNGFQALLSSKKPTDPRMYLSKTVIYLYGHEVWRDDQMYPGPEEEPGPKEMGILLFASLYTVPNNGMGFYAPRDAWTVQVRGCFGSAGGASPARPARADTE